MKDLNRVSLVLSEVLRSRDDQVVYRLEYVVKQRRGEKTVFASCKVVVVGK